MTEVDTKELREAKRSGRLITFAFVAIPLVLIVIVLFLTYAVSGQRHKSLSAGKTFYSLENMENYVLARDAAGRPLALVGEGAALPRGYPDIQAVRVPVKRVAVATGEFDAGIMESLGMADSVIALSLKQEEVYSPRLSERYKEGKITYLGQPYPMNYELVKSLEPDLVLCPSLRDAEILEEMGLPTSVSYSPLDNSLEARMFFVDYIAAFAGKDREARAFQDRVEEALAALDARSAGLPKTKVMWAVVFEKRVFVEPGENWVGEMIPRLGADYLFSHVKGDSTIEVSLEHFVEVGRDADVLVLYPDPYQLNGSKEDIIRQNSNLAPLRPLGPDGRAFATLPIFYESFGRLDEIADELFAIFHPTMYPNREFVFFRELH
ncbi:MAG: ABC transporter substrate-binding protein [Deltaproteobacteria bacterium]|jgi:iron complex transport system substrate-binding protein|nr:ABC transporter substrate-binding protein [Deltaproteobacteria bacterium]